MHPPLNVLSPQSPVKGFATQLYSFNCFFLALSQSDDIRTYSNFLMRVMALTFSPKVLKCPVLSDPSETPLLQFPRGELGANHRIPAHKISLQLTSLGPQQEILSGFCILTAHGFLLSQGTAESWCLSVQHTPRESPYRICRQERWC